MMNIKVLGPGCANCKRLANMVQNVVKKHGLAAEIEKVTDYGEIMKWNILSTPGLVVNDKLVVAGRVPREQEIVGYLT